MFRALEYLESIGIGERLKGKFRIRADRCIVGTAREDKSGEKGLLIILESTPIHMEFTFIITDRELLRSMGAAINRLLEEEERREVA